MKTRSTSRPVSGAERRGAAKAPATAQLKDAPAVAMVDVRAVSLAQLQLQQVASHSSQAAEIEQELESLNDRRRALMKETIDDGHELWLPGSIKGEDRISAKNLWSSISANRGNLQVEKNDPEFRVSALSDVSKLLQSAHGRSMLGKLNAQQKGNGGRTIDIAPTTGETDNAPKMPLGDGHAGEGSVVSINYAEPRQSSMGKAGEPIYDPSYIKLGHELGHASHYLAGTAGSSGHIAGNDDQIEESLWTSQEEYDTITGEENPLRSDLGLSSRIYHQSHDEVLRARKILPAIQALAVRHEGLDIKSLTKNHADVLDDAEAWMHPSKKWSQFKLPELNKAIEEAFAAMTRLEKIGR